jgi:exonuclease III
VNIVSLNMNKRLGTITVQRSFDMWLKQKQPDILLCQEPFSPKSRNRFEPHLMHTIGQHNLVHSWRAAAIEVQEVRCSARWQTMTAYGLHIHNVYFPSDNTRDDRRARIELLDLLANAVETAPTTTVIFGDFNMAPSRTDGIHGTATSTFTKRTEQEAFLRLLKSGPLIDTTSPSVLESQEYTIERPLSGKISRFRCDLALVSADLFGSFQSEYDHSVRLSPNKFTDHSAVISRIVLNA